MHNVVYVCGKAVKKSERLVVLVVHIWRITMASSALPLLGNRQPVALYTFCTQFIRMWNVSFAQFVQALNSTFSSVIFNFYPLSTAPIINTITYINQ
jgi:hypothetical protein